MSWMRCIGLGILLGLAVISVYRLAVYCKTPCLGECSSGKTHRDGITSGPSFWLGGGQ